MALDEKRDTVIIPAAQIPSFRTSAAIERGVETNILLKTWGGLGDQICAEPTLRYALETFKNCKVSIASEHPTLFRHLEKYPNFERMFDLKQEQPIWDQYLAFDTINDPSNLTWEFMSHMLVNCVDFPSMCAFRCQLPIKSKEIKLEPTPQDIDATRDLPWEKKIVAVHPGKHWQSKTFPKKWWDSVIDRFAERGEYAVVLIGASTDDNRATVDVNTEGCIDLRNKLSVMESVSLLHRVDLLLTNDSAPMHMAASGCAHIAFIATCKHPDYIMHWRKGEFGWRMKNLGLGGIWDVLDYCPNKKNTVEAENVGDLLEKWLPHPDSVFMQVESMLLDD